eukprot:11427031-Alexandrium_andersonii.AAC.1
MQPSLSSDSSISAKVEARAHMHASLLPESWPSPADMGAQWGAPGARGLASPMAGPPPFRTRPGA